MAFTTIEFSRRAKVGILTLNRPEKRNALSIQMRNEIDACLEELEQEGAVSAIVVLANGPSFCGGFDTKEFYERAPNHIQAMKDSSARYHRRLAEFPKPLIAAVHGPAMGGGFDLAVLCDIRIAAPEATFAHPEIKFGAPALFGPLKEIIGGGLARDLVFTGRTIDAAEAHRIGLVSQIIPAEALRETALGLAEVVTQAPLSTLKSIKRQIVQSYGGWQGFVAGAESDGFFDFL